MLFVGICTQAVVFSTQAPSAALRRREAGERGKESAS